MTRAIILAAGFGTRLGTLSDERPKPLLPVCDIPLIRYALALLRGHGITEIAVNLHHRGELIEAELGDERAIYSREEVILGTGGGIAQDRRLAHPRRRATRSSWSTARSSSTSICTRLRARHDAARRRRHHARARDARRRTAGAPSRSTTTAASPRIIGQGTPGAHARACSPACT